MGRWRPTRGRDGSRRWVGSSVAAFAPDIDAGGDLAALLRTPGGRGTASVCHRAGLWMRVSPTARGSRLPDVAAVARVDVQHVDPAGGAGRHPDQNCAASPAWPTVAEAGGTVVASLNPLPPPALVMAGLSGAAWEHRQADGCQGERNRQHPSSPRWLRGRRNGACATRLF